MSVTGVSQRVPRDTLDAGCPDWCTSAHGVQEGEEDWLHLGAPLLLADGVTARLCMSYDPRTRQGDGPFVLIGDRECTLDEAAALGVSLTELADRGAPASSAAGG